jgi:hypothetical protein
MTELQEDVWLFQQLDRAKLMRLWESMPLKQAQRPGCQRVGMRGRTIRDWPRLARRELIEMPKGRRTVSDCDSVGLPGVSGD